MFSCTKKINDNLIEQIKTFKDLGIVFQFSNNWKERRKELHFISCTKKPSNAIIRFANHNRNNYVLTLIMFFRVKVLSLILYGAQIYAYKGIKNSERKTLEVIQCKFLRAMLCDFAIFQDSLKRETHLRSNLLKY